MKNERHVVCSEQCRGVLLTPIQAQRELEKQHRKPARVIAVMNQKGGTGKTTTSVSIAAGFAERGHSTLLIDLDGQGNVGVSLGVRGPKTLYHVLIEECPPEAAAIPIRGNLDVITSDQSMAAAEIQLVSFADRARVLTKRMASVVDSRAYEYIILDCAPSLSLLNQNALTFAKEVVVPVSCDYLSLVGVKQILSTLRHVNQQLLHPIEVLGVLPTLFDVRNKIARESLQALKDYFKSRVLPPIRINSKLKEAPSHKKTIFEYAPESHGAEDYQAAVEWILERTPRSEQALAAVATTNPTVRAE